MKKIVRLILTIVLMFALVSCHNSDNEKITVSHDESMSTTFVMNSKSIDFTKYFTIKKGKNKVTVTSQMIDDSNVDYNTPGRYIVVLNYESNGNEYKDFLNIEIVADSIYILNQVLEKSDFSNYTLTNDDVTYKYVAGCHEIIENGKSVYAIYQGELEDYKILQQTINGWEESTGLGDITITNLSFLKGAEFLESDANGYYLAKESTSLSENVLGYRSIAFKIKVSNDVVSEIVADNKIYNVTYGSTSINIPTNIFDPYEQLADLFNKLAGYNYCYQETVILDNLGQKETHRYGYGYDTNLMYFDNNGQQIWYEKNGRRALMYYYDNYDMVATKDITGQISDMAEYFQDVFGKLDIEMFTVNSQNVNEYNMKEDYLQTAAKEFTGIKDYANDGAGTSLTVEFISLSISFEDDRIFVDYEAVGDYLESGEIKNYEYTGTGEVTKIGLNKIVIPNNDEPDDGTTDELKEAFSHLKNNHTYQETMVDQHWGETFTYRCAWANGIAYYYNGEYNTDMWLYLNENNKLMEAYHHHVTGELLHQVSNYPRTFLNSYFDIMNHTYFVNNQDNTYSVKPRFLNYIGKHFTSLTGVESDGYKEEVDFKEFIITLKDGEVYQIYYEAETKFYIIGEPSIQYYIGNGIVSNIGTTSFELGVEPEFVELESDPNPSSLFSNVNNTAYLSKNFNKLKSFGKKEK